MDEGAGPHRAAGDGARGGGGGDPAEGVEGGLEIGLCPGDIRVVGHIPGAVEAELRPVAHDGEVGEDIGGLGGRLLARLPAGLPEQLLQEVFGEGPVGGDAAQAAKGETLKEQLRPRRGRKAHPLLRAGRPALRRAVGAARAGLEATGLGLKLPRARSMRSNYQQDRRTVIK